MGLAAAKNKRKLGNDPNNTKWSRNTDTFGQKILRSQGWQPGEYLGAKDAPHAEWHTEANTSHIRVVLKDDTLGLGAKRNNGDECTGLDAFQHLLGRLNGKTEEVLETERKVREDMKLSRYFEQKFGAVRFVRGGWLVGDQLQMTPDEEAEKDVAEASESAAGRSKKRKAEQDTDRDDEKARKKEKKEKRRKADSEAEADAEPVKEKKDKKKSKKRRAESEGSDDKASAAPAAGASLDDSSAEVKKAKKDKKEKREKKEKRKKDRTGSDSGAEVGDSISKEKKRRKDGESSSSAPTPAESSTTTPSGSGYSTPVTTSTRYLARSRFIAQKRMAFADAAALNQIFMIKS